MGKKSKNTFKNTKNSGKTHASDASNRKMSGMLLISFLSFFFILIFSFLERRLEEFEKSIATMVNP